MATEGPLNPANVANIALGTVVWTNTGNAAGAIDGVYATTAAPAGGPHQTDNLRSTMGASSFSIPAGAVIDGIQVCVQKRRSGPSCVDTDVRIVKGLVIGATNRSTGAAWPPFSSPALVCYGGPADLWGEVWTPADINSGQFGYAIAASIQNFSSAQVDASGITVWYTPAGGNGNPNLITLCPCCDVKNGGDMGPPAE